MIETSSNNSSGLSGKGITYFSRIAWAIGIGFVLLHAGIALYHANESLVSQATDLVVATAERARVVGELTADHADQSLALAKISGPNFAVFRSKTPELRRKSQRSWHREPLIRKRVTEGLLGLGLAPEDVRFHFDFHRGDARLRLSLRTESSGDWLVVDTTARPARWQRHIAGLVWTACLALLIFALVFWVTRRYTRTLPVFVAAAERVGHLGTMEPLPEDSGPREIRRLGSAFNRMQERIKAHEHERSTMLGAVSHDLRTFITRLSLRLQNEPEIKSADKMESDLRAMMHIVDEALAYSRDEVSDEEPVALELSSLLQTMVDDHNEISLDDAPRVEGVLCDADAVRIVAQPLALQRAVQNVIDNALLYGGSAAVAVRVTTDAAVIVVRDQGNGIPEADQERVLKPYVRLEESRNRDTGGTGLGLAIASNVLRRQGGSVTFETLDEGFCVLLQIPLAENR